MVGVWAIVWRHGIFRASRGAELPSRLVAAAAGGGSALSNGHNRHLPLSTLNERLGLYPTGITP